MRKNVEKKVFLDLIKHIFKMFARRFVFLVQSIRWDSSQALKIDVQGSTWLGTDRNVNLFEVSRLQRHVLSDNRRLRTGTTISNSSQPAHYSVASLASRKIQTAKNQPHTTQLPCVFVCVGWNCSLAGHSNSLFCKAFRYSHCPFSKAKGSCARGAAQP